MFDWMRGDRNHLVDYYKAQLGDISTEEQAALDKAQAANMAAAAGAHGALGNSAAVQYAQQQNAVAAQNIANLANQRRLAYLQALSAQQAENNKQQGTWIDRIAGWAGSGISALV